MILLRELTLGQTVKFGHFVCEYLYVCVCVCVWVGGCDQRGREREEKEYMEREVQHTIAPSKPSEYNQISQI